MYKYLVKSVEQRNQYFVLTLTPSDEDKEVFFTPGQYATIGFKVNGRPSPMRCFSFVSSPIDSELKFATRARGHFTSKLSQLEAGEEINLQGPFGHFVIEPKQDKHIVMVAAGIGITPFMSMLRWANDTQFTTPITLFYSNRDRTLIPFYDEIQIMQRQNPNLNVVFLVDGGEHDQANRVYSGKLNSGLIQNAVGNDYHRSTFLICGPQGFMDNVSNDLKNDKINSDQIVTESFKQKSKISWSLSNLGITTKTYVGAALILGLLVGIVSLFDLLAYVPKKSAALNALPATTISAPVQTRENNDDEQPATPTTTTQTTTTNPTPTTAPTPTTTAPSTTTTQPYQAPVSTVS